MQERDLDELLGQMRAHPPAPSAHFMERLLSDGMALQPKAAPPLVGRDASATHGSRFAWLLAMIGGRAALAGMAVAALLGLWFGYADPAGMSEDFSIYADAGLELTPAAELFLIEG